MEGYMRLFYVQRPQDGRREAYRSGSILGGELENARSLPSSINGVDDAIIASAVRSQRAVPKLR